MDHQNICTVYEVDETSDGQSYIVMAYYKGETLRKKLEQGKLSIDESVDIAIQIARGLAEAHENGIVHRDIKPANILITKKGDVKILDFGLAKLSGQTLLTKTGSTLGTVAYMSPEQAQGMSVDNRSDLWSLGVIIYGMLSGIKPFTGEFDQAVMYSIVNNEPESLSTYCPDISSELLHVVNRSLEKDPKDRFQSVEAILHALNLKNTKMFRRFKEPGVLVKRFGKFNFVMLTIILIFALILVIFYMYHINKTNWVYEKAIPEITQIAEEKEFSIEAYNLLLKVEKYVPNEPSIKKLWQQFSKDLTIHSGPPNASVFYKVYSDSTDN